MDVADAGSWIILILTMFVSSVFMLVDSIRGIGGGSMHAWMSAFIRLLFTSFMMLVDVVVTHSDFAKGCTCLTRLILKTHSRCRLGKVIILDVYCIVILYSLL